MENLLFKCTLSNSTRFNDLGIEIWLDNNKFFDQNISTGSHHIAHTFPEDEAEHSLRFVLKNKQLGHTTINDTGEIISDALINISDISFDNVEIDQLFFEHATYTHDFNGATKLTNTKFYGSMGCNGTLELNFSTPFYMWLLEHM